MKRKSLKSNLNEVCYKLTVRRKRFGELCRRQQNRIRREMKMNIKLSDFSKISFQESEPSLPKSETVNDYSFQNKEFCLENGFVETDVNEVVYENCKNTDEDPFFNDFLFRNVSADVTITNDENEKEEETIREKLRKCFLLSKIKLHQGTAILKVLKTVSDLAALPSDCRTLYQTPREKVPFSVVEPGLYLHIGFKQGLENILKRT